MSRPRVEVGVLVKGNSQIRMPVAEDVATLSTVVAADKVVESAFAGWVVTYGGLGIELVTRHVSGCVTCYDPMMLGHKADSKQSLMVGRRIGYLTFQCCLLGNEVISGYWSRSQPLVKSG